MSEADSSSKAELLSELAMTVREEAAGDLWSDFVFERLPLVTDEIPRTTKAERDYDYLYDLVTELHIRFEQADAAGEYEAAWQHLIERYDLMDGWLKVFDRRPVSVAYNQVCEYAVHRQLPIEEFENRSGDGQLHPEQTRRDSRDLQQVIDMTDDPRQTLEALELCVQYSEAEPKARAQALLEIGSTRRWWSEVLADPKRLAEYSDRSREELGELPPWDSEASGLCCSVRENGTPELQRIEEQQKLQGTLL